MNYVLKKYDRFIKNDTTVEIKNFSGHSQTWPKGGCLSLISRVENEGLFSWQACFST